MYFLQFLVIKTLYPDLDPDSLEMLDPEFGFNESGSATLQATEHLFFSSGFLTDDLVFSKDDEGHQKYFGVCR